MRLLLLIFTLYGSTGIAGESDIINDCSSCHLSNRSKVSNHFPTGFGRWTNFQCFGCHQEIDQVIAEHRKQGSDPRFSSLPISDKRISIMESYPLPYLDAPEIP